MPRDSKHVDVNNPKILPPNNVAYSNEQRDNIQRNRPNINPWETNHRDIKELNTRQPNPQTNANAMNSINTNEIHSFLERILEERLANICQRVEEKVTMMVSSRIPVMIHQNYPRQMNANLVQHQRKSLDQTYPQAPPQGYMPQQQQMPSHVSYNPTPQTIQNPQQPMQLPVQQCV